MKLKAMCVCFFVFLCVCVCVCVFGSYFIQVKELFTRNNEQSGEAYIHISISESSIIMITEVTLWKIRRRES